MPRIKDEVLMQFINTSTKMRKLMFSHFQNLDSKMQSFEDKATTMLQFNALGLLEKDPKITVGDLAKELSMSSGAIAQLVDRLVASKWVERFNDESDRRVVRLSLTKLGEEHLKEVGDKMKERMSKILSLIEERDVKILIRIQNKLLERLENKLSKTQE